MLKLSIPDNPNQSVSFDSKYGVFKITFRYLGSILLCNVDFKNENIVEGVRVVNNKWLIPYKYLCHGIGNFRVVSSNEDYPHYSDVGKSWNIVYYDEEEFNNEEETSVG